MGGPGDARAVFRVREAVEADFSHIGGIAEAAGLFPAAMLDSMIAGYLGRRTRDIWLVADAGGYVQGFATCRPEPLTDGTWNLLVIAVDPAVQRSGHGSALLAAIETRVADGGAHLLVIETSDAAEQAAARAFYAVRGYREEARISGFWAPGIAKVIFTKVISGRVAAAESGFG